MSIALIKGGRSLESPVSERSARQISRALSDEHDIVEVQMRPDLLHRLQQLQPQFAILSVHGRGGEDGSLQYLLDVIDLPYTGSDSGTSALCWDKVLLKHQLRRMGIDTPWFEVIDKESVLLTEGSDFAHALSERVPLPWVIKPAREGSSFGLHFVEDADDYAQAVVNSFNYDHKLLVESFVEGREFAVTIYGDGLNLPIVEVLKAGVFYDHSAHYESGFAQLQAAELDQALHQQIIDQCCRVYAQLGCRDFARFDLIVDQQQVIQFLEVNTLPGLTATSPTIAALQLADISLTDFLHTAWGRLFSTKYHSH